MTFARVKGRPSESQRRWLGMMESLGGVMALSLRPATRRKLVELGYAEIRCSTCDVVATSPASLNGHRMVLTDRGRKYLVNWRRAYGAAA